jgi:hypothetical protein
LSSYVECPYTFASILPGEYFYGKETNSTAPTSTPASTPLPLLYYKKTMGDYALPKALLEANDKTTLMYLEALGSFGVALYSHGFAEFTAAEFLAERYSTEEYLYLGFVNQHAIAHSLALETILNNKTYPDCSYDFSSIHSVRDLFDLAAFYENLATGAYGAVIEYLSDPNYRLLVATIATVDAEHSAWLSSVLHRKPFTPQEHVYSPMETLEMLKPFVTCSFNFSMPLKLDTVPNWIYPGAYPAASPVKSFPKMEQTQYYQPGASMIGYPQNQMHPTPAPGHAPGSHVINVNMRDATPK